jgi:hypothetical protein
MHECERRTQEIETSAQSVQVMLSLDEGAALAVVLLLLLLAAVLLAAKSGKSCGGI